MKQLCDSRPNISLADNGPRYEGSNNTIYLADSDDSCFDWFEEKCEVYIAHEVLHSLLHQLFNKALSHDIDNLRHKYKHHERLNWIFHEL